ncbi:restriction endonuclease subunit S [Vibrio fluvialis]|uniref:restriction endonuclease subunit S n=1 Tax=Vibrio fluvialis TaxID=676 RepID=UPI001EEA0450|nr:restriction endonuclease subunit S [Vibrio fluvialis]MCG6359394.1 restriction endonuclease subunit S [Vibrio fluvialis]
MSGVAEVSSKYLTEIASNPTPLGYKQTEVGIIPEDWEIFSLPEVIWYQEGPGLRKWQFKSKGLKVINVTNLQESGYLDLDRTDRHISWDEFEKTYKHFACDEGDLVIASSGNSYCKASIVRACDLPLLMNTSVIRFKPIGEFSKGYMEVYLKSPYFKDQIDLLITGGAQPNFGPAHLNLIKIPAPTCAKEQTAIANALSDVDALISELEKLIAKKQAIKTATMQQLLTGRTRLPQFALREDGTPKGTKTSELGKIPEDWEVVTLGDIGQTVIGLTYSPNDVADFGALVLRSSNVQNGKLAYADNVYVNMELPERVIVKQGDILICVRNGSRQLIGKCALIDENAEGSAFGAFMSIFRTKYSVFVFYQFQSDLIQNQINEIMGATINQITNKDMSGFKITLPSDEKEQTAIASILSDMDAEIQALEQRLGKTRQIKQGMMQELLTGKTRLIQGSEVR